MIRLTLNIDPIAKGRPRFTRAGRAYTPAQTKRFESATQALIRSQYKADPLKGPLTVVMHFLMRAPKRKVRTHPDCKPDLDNLMKAIKDAANGILWEDDSQIVDVIATKRYDWVSRKTGIEIHVREMES